MRSVTSAVLALVAAGMLVGCGTVRDPIADRAGIDEATQRNDDEQGDDAGVLLYGEWHRVAGYGGEENLLYHELRTFDRNPEDLKWEGTYTHVFHPNLDGFEPEQPSEQGRFEGKKVKPDKRGLCDPMPECPENAVYAADGTGYWSLDPEEEGYANLWVVSQGEVLWWIARFDWGPHEIIACPWYRSFEGAWEMENGTIDMSQFWPGWVRPTDCTWCFDGHDFPPFDNFVEADGTTDVCAYSNGPIVELNCTDGLDNDMDGAADGADPDCE